MGKLKHKRRTPPRRPDDHRRTLTKQKRVASAAQHELRRWQFEAGR
jgi:hypothetical protein